MMNLPTELRQLTMEELRACESFLKSKGWQELSYTAGRWQDPTRSTQILKTHEAIAEQQMRDAAIVKKKANSI